MMLGQYSGELSGYNSQQQAQAAMMQGLGSAAGYAFGGAKKPWILQAKGGVIRRNKGSGLYRSVTKGYAEGGIVEGPGDGTVDTVPAVIDGKQPAALANGEGVLNAEAVKMVGEQFVHGVNKAALLLKQIASKGVSREVAYG
jgi:hypothetical protein